MGDGLPSPFGGLLARGWQPYPYTTRVRSGGLLERMAMRGYVVHPRYRRIRGQAPIIDALPSFG
jgi:hypothetical protein